MPRFLERDEAHPPRADRALPLGRRGGGAALPRGRGADRRRRLLAVAPRGSESQALPHVPVLRAGVEYESLDAQELTGYRDGRPLARISRANAGLIRRDLARIGAAAERLRAIPTAELARRSRDAARRFLEDTLPLNAQGDAQSPEDYVRALSATSGLPHVLVRANMAKVATVLGEIERILGGLTRGLDLGVLDSGMGAAGRQPGLLRADHQRARRDPAEQLARRELDLDPLGRAAHARRAQARPRGALDPAAHRARADRRRLPPRGLQLLPDRPRGLGGDPRAHRSLAALRRRLDHQALGRRPPRAAPRARLEQGAARRRSSAALRGARRRAGRLGRRQRRPELRQRLDDPDPVARRGDRRRARPAPGRHRPARRRRPRRGAVRLPQPQDGRGHRRRHRARPGRRRGRGRHRALPPRPAPRRARRRDLPPADDPAAATRSTTRWRARNTSSPSPASSRCPSPSCSRPSARPWSSAPSRKDEALRRALLACRSIDRLNLGPLPTSRVEWNQPHEGNLFELLYQRRAIQSASGW